MKTTNALALSALFLNSFVAAYPSKRHDHGHLHKKRDVVYVTEDVFETVYSTTTIWVDPTSAAGGEFYEQPAQTSEAPASSSAAAAPYTAPSVAPPSSSVVAPASEYTPPAASSTPVAASSSAYVAPTSAEVAPSSTYVAPSSAYVAPSSAEVASSAAATPSATAASSNGGGEKYSGDVTYYNPAGGYGACGFNIADSDHVVAIAHDTWDSKGTMSNGNPWCGTSITILNKSTGKTFPAKIGDKCMGTDATPCTGGNLDLAQGFFDEAFPGVDGRGKDIMEWWV